ncbi:SMI1/KNR4 family protein [Streptomyces cavourensis]|uniref:SMI1/KNR4 family protein n=1 Tax=Streptomyces bacillaris TaxID=68179 RepID=UPI003695D786
MIITDSLDDSLQRIARWASDQPLATAPPLNSPASDAEIDSVGRVVGIGTPPPLATLLRFSNGLDWYRLFPTGEGLMSCGQIELAYARNTETARQSEDSDWWRPEWVPFARRPEGHEGFLIDAGHPAHPILKYTEADYPRPFAPSMARLFSALAAALCGTQDDPELPFCGRSPAVVDGAIDWT